MSRHFVTFCLSLFVASSTLNGCGAAVDDETDIAHDGEDLTFNATPPTGIVYDAGTQCTAGGVTMHCCPAGYAMIGARLDQNIFKCGRVDGGLFGSPYLDGSTQRNNMHSCPFGMVMVGFHEDRNLLACQWPTRQSVVFEYVDGSTQDSYPMHVCPPTSASSYFYNGYAMSGIRVDRNLFACSF